ncbi:TetR/AcrR family transcriptional regulator [Desulfogranum japonicum]|uniref:TetR/AcrR family transcriptional regulator n=1 Tax=Desulfogranum japonicum TaxID=231447 RepID=UPI00040EC7D1|nr:TetR/AcrR family transcriptional regulator [Desulfogranum japonicum]
MGRNREINQVIKEERRERILYGALELFALNGLAGTKISDIARHTNMSNGLVYHYFASKEDIFIELTRTALERMLAACRYLENLDLPPHKKIRYAMDELVKTIRTKPEAGYYHLLIAQAAASTGVPAEVKVLLNTKRAIPYDTIAGIISQGQKLGTIRQGRAEDLAFFFWNNINGIALHQVMYGKSARCPHLSTLYHMFFTREAENG